MLLPIPMCSAPRNSASYARSWTWPTGQTVASPPVTSRHRPRTTRSCPKTAPLHARPVRWCWRHSHAAARSFGSVAAQDLSATVQSLQRRAVVRLSRGQRGAVRPQSWRRRSGAHRCLRHAVSQRPGQLRRWRAGHRRHLRHAVGQAAGRASGDLSGHESAQGHAGHTWRVACFFWAQSMLRDAAQRRLLFELDVSIRRLTQDTPGHPH